MPAPCRILVLCQETGRAALVRRVLTADPSGQEILVDAGALSAALATDDGPRRVATADIIVVTHALEDEIAASAGRLLNNARPDAAILVLNSLRPLLLKTRLRDFRLADARRRARFLPIPRAVKGLLTADDITPHLRELLATLPQIIHKIPSRKGDLRAFLTAMLYWKEPTPRNIRNLLFMLADRYGPRPGTLTRLYEPPLVHPDLALYHPDTGFTQDPQAIPTPVDPVGTIGLLLTRGPLLSEDRAAADTLIRALEARGFRTLPAYAESFDFRAAVDRFFRPVGIDLLINATGFPLVGGHNNLDREGSATYLADLGVPYFTPPSLMTQTPSQWQHSRMGLQPMEVAMQLAIHEIEGGIEPLVVQGASSTGARHGLDDRPQHLASRALAWRRLQTAHNRDKRIAITLFSFPPGKGSVGTAAYLDVFRSAHALLLRLQDEGYTVDVPDSAEALLQRVIDSGDPRAPIAAAGMAVAARLSTADYERLCPEWTRARRLWGEPPGELNTDGRALLIHGVQLGNVFIGVQPSFGFEGDPMRLLFDPSATPHHGFLAYYTWIEHVFGAVACVHLGTHGALEFMPGKQAGLSKECWPDVLMGSVPNIYIYAVNNPSEGTIAKRRGGAVTITHLTPPSELAGLAKDLDALKGLLDAHRASTDAAVRASTWDAVITQAAELHLTVDPSVSSDDESARLRGALREIASRRIPIGLHTVGRHPRDEEVVEILAAMAALDDPSATPRSLAAAILQARGDDAHTIVEGHRRGELAAIEPFEQACSMCRQLAAAWIRAGDDGVRQTLRNEQLELPKSVLCAVLARWHRAREGLAAGDEIRPVMRALEGRFIPAGPGGDPVRSQDVLPVGRNLHALDPARVPSPAALVQAQHTVDLLLEQRRRELGAWPKRIGMILWGLDNIKTQGEGIAQAFLLLGVRPCRNSIGRMSALEVIPLEELGRPRIDVTISASGIFRDLFGAQLALLDEAVHRVAALEEPLDMNFVRASVVELMNGGLNEDDARTRIFSNAPGTYGAHVDQMVMTSAWSEREDLAEIYAQRKGHAFTRDGKSHDAHQALIAVSAGIDTTFQNLDSTEVSVTDVDHYFEYLGGLTALIERGSGKRPDAVIADATGAALRIRSLEDTVRLESRARLLNPKWYEGMLAHGYEGVEEVRKRLDYTFGWSATADAVDSWVYRDAHRAFLENDDVRERMLADNPHSLMAMVDRLVEADGRGFWTATDEERARLLGLQDRLEDALEGVTSPATP